VVKVAFGEMHRAAAAVVDFMAVAVEEMMDAAQVLTAAVAEVVVPHWYHPVQLVLLRIMRAMVTLQSLGLQAWFR
jgi:hypothetical protein